jgi:hypothetical protein
VRERPIGPSKGPWEIEDCGVYDELLIASEDTGGGYVATVYESDCNWGRLNAKLIAAAPDLLEACESIHADLDYLQRLWGPEGVTQRAVEKLEAAIRKAKGEQ